MMKSVADEEWSLLLSFLLSQRLEINAIESALKSAGVLTDDQVKTIRTQALHTARTWSGDPSQDMLTLIRIHSSPAATMVVPLAQETRDQLRREIDDQTPQR
jgi:hypothetical protein